jgi:hypothetical protein
LRITRDSASRVLNCGFFRFAFRVELAVGSRGVRMENGRFHAQGICEKVNIKKKMGTGYEEAECGIGAGPRGDEELRPVGSKRDAKNILYATPHRGESWRQR